MYLRANFIPTTTAAVVPSPYDASLSFLFLTDDEVPLTRSPPSAAPISPGWIALHGNQSELLADAVMSWLQAHPLGPLEEEIVLVQSNGVAEWFKRFLGCTDVVIALKETKKLVETINHFAETQQLEAPQRDELMERAHLVLEEMGERGDPLTLKTVAEQIFPDAPARLAETLQDEALDLATGFVPDKRALRPLIRFKAAAADWKLEFERSSLRGGSVHYDKESNTLVLSNIPAKLRQMLLEE